MDSDEDVFDLTQCSDEEGVAGTIAVSESTKATVADEGFQPQQKSNETQELKTSRHNPYSEDDSESDSSSSDEEVYSLSQRMAKWQSEKDTRKRRSQGPASSSSDGAGCEGRPVVPEKRRALSPRPRPRPPPRRRQPKVESHPTTTTTTTIALLSSEEDEAGDDGSGDQNHSVASRLGAAANKKEKKEKLYANHHGSSSSSSPSAAAANHRAARGLKPPEGQPQDDQYSAPFRVKAQPVKGPHESPTSSSYSSSSLSSSSSSSSSWLDGARGVVIGSQTRSLSRSSSSNASSSSSRSTSSASVSGAEARRLRRIAKEAEKKKKVEERAAAKAVREEKKAELKRNKLRLQEQSGRFRSKELQTCFSPSIDSDLFSLVKALVASDDRAFQEPRVQPEAPCENAVWWRRVSTIDGKPMDPPVRPFTGLCVVPGAFALELLHKSPVGDGSRLVDHLLVCREALLLHAVAEEDASRVRREERWGYGGDDSDGNSHRVIFVVQGIDASIASYHAASYANTHRHAASPRHVTNKSFDEICTAAYVSDDLEIHCTKDNQETAEYIVELLTQLTSMQYEVDDDLAAFSLSKKYTATTLDGFKSSWLQQLQVVPRCSLSRARRIAALYPSLGDLMRAYENPALSESDRELLLAGVVGARSDAVLSRRIFRVLNSLTPHELV